MLIYLSLGSICILMHFLRPQQGQRMKESILLILVNSTDSSSSLRIDSEFVRWTAPLND